MKLYLAVAVLVLAFVAYTEAQEESAEQKFDRFREQMSEIGQSLAEKAKSAVQRLQNSDVAERTQTWFQEKIQALQNHFNGN